MKKIFWVIVLIFIIYVSNHRDKKSETTQQSADYDYAKSELRENCRNAISAEIYMAKAMVYKNNGSTVAYQNALQKAKEYGAEVGYPDAAVEVRVMSNAPQAGLADLDDSGIVIAPLVEDCLIKPGTYIINYKSAPPTKS